jgi:HK97 family phage major capsid protein
MSEEVRKAPTPGAMQHRVVTVELTERVAGDDRIPVAISSEYAVERSYGREVLVHTREAVDMEHAERGLPFLDSHDPTRQLGIVEDVHVGPDRKLRGMLRKGNHPDAEWVFRDIEAGIRCNLSGGYMHLEAERDASDRDLYRVTRWRPMEVSTVSIPADITVGVGRSATTTTETVTTMTSITIDTNDADPEAVAQSIESVTPKEALPATAERTVPAEVRDKQPIRAKENTMSEQANTDGAAPTPGAAVKVGMDKSVVAREIALICNAHGASERIPEFIQSGFTVEEAKAALFDARVAEARKVSPAGHLDLSEREASQFSYTRAIANLMTKRWEENGGLEKEVSDAIAKRANRTTGGFFVPLDLKIRASVTGNIVATSSLGGASVQTDILSLIDILRNKMMVRQLGATVLSGLSGNISFPRHIVANTMAWEGENPSTAHAHSAATLDNVTLSPKTAMASSAYSRQLLIQSSFDVGSFVQNDLANVLALGLDLAAIDGTGSANQPTGIMRQTNVTTIVHTGTAAGGIPTFAEMVGYETAVADSNADIGNMAFLSTPGVRGKLKTVLKSTTAGSAYIWEGDNTINGYRAYASKQVPSGLTYGTSTTVAHGIVFGVWSELLIGEWGGALEVIVDPYTSANQNMVNITQMLLADIAVKHPKAFAITKSALIA